MFCSTFGEVFDDSALMLFGVQVYQAKLALHLGNTAPPAQRCLAAARLALGDLHGARSTLDSLKTSTMPREMSSQVAKVYSSSCRPSGLSMSGGSLGCKAVWGALTGCCDRGSLYTLSGTTSALLMMRLMLFLRQYQSDGLGGA